MVEASQEPSVCLTKLLEFASLGKIKDGIRDKDVRTVDGCIAFVKLHLVQIG